MSRTPVAKSYPASIVSQNENLPQGELEIIAVAGRELRNTEWLGKMDPYLVFQMDYVKKKIRPHKGGGRNPKWNQSIRMEIINGRRLLNVKCYDLALMTDELVGQLDIPLESVFQTGESDNWYKLMHPSKNKTAGEVRLQMIFYEDQVEQEAAAPLPPPLAVKSPPQSALGIHPENEQAYMNTPYSNSENTYHASYVEQQVQENESPHQGRFPTEQYDPAYMNEMRAPPSGHYRAQSYPGVPAPLEQSPYSAESDAVSSQSNVRRTSASSLQTQTTQLTADGRLPAAHGPQYRPNISTARDEYEEYEYSPTESELYSPGPRQYANMPVQYRSRPPPPVLQQPPPPLQHQQQHYYEPSYDQRMQRPILQQVPPPPMPGYEYSGYARAAPPPKANYPMAPRPPYSGPPPQNYSNNPPQNYPQNYPPHQVVQSPRNYQNPQNVAQNYPPNQNQINYQNSHNLAQNYPPNQTPLNYQNPPYQNRPNMAQHMPYPMRPVPHHVVPAPDPTRRPLPQPPAHATPYDPRRGYPGPARSVSPLPPAHPPSDVSRRSAPNMQYQLSNGAPMRPPASMQPPGRKQ